MSLVFLSECKACGAYEERVFEDSWTGVELCLDCLCQIAEQITNSPASEGDNLARLMTDVLEWEDDDSIYESYDDAFGR